MSDFDQLKEQVDRLTTDVAQMKRDQDSFKEEIRGEYNQLSGYADTPTMEVIRKVFEQLFFQDTQTVTAGFIILPTTGYIKIIASGAARTSSTSKAIDNGLYRGQMLFLEGTSDANTVTIKDTANTQMAGDCTLGIYDTLFLIWNGAYWIELARSNN